MRLPSIFLHLCSVFVITYSIFIHDHDLRASTILDSLANLEIVETNTERLRQLGFSSRYFSPYQSIAYSLKILNEQSSDAVLKTGAHYNIISQLIYISEIKAAKQYLKKINAEDNPLLQAHKLFFQGVFYGQDEAAAKALDSYYLALEKYNEIGGHKNMVRLYAALAMNKGVLHLFDDAYTYFNKALEAAAEYGYDDEERILINYSFFLIEHAGKSKQILHIDLADSLAQRAFEIVSEKKLRPDYLLISLALKLRVSLLKYKPEAEVLKDMDMGLSLMSKVMGDEIKTDFLSAASLVCARLKSPDLPKALSLTEESLLISKKSETYEQMARAYKSQSEIYSLMGEPDKMQTASHKADSVLYILNAKKQKELISKSDLQASLKKEKDKALLSKEENFFLKWTTGVSLVASALLLVLILMAWQLFKKKKQSRAKLLAKHKKLKQAHVSLNKNNKTIKKQKVVLEEQARSLEAKLKKQLMVVANDLRKLTELEELVKGSKGVSPKAQREILRLTESTQNKRVLKEIDFEFARLHSEFYVKLTKINSSLTANNLRLCVFLKMNLSTKEIAILMFSSPESTKTARSRLRKKLNIDPSVSISAFLNALV